MENRVGRRPTIADDNLREILEEVTKELGPLFQQEVSTEEKQAFSLFLGTLSAMTQKIFDYLPSEQRGEILTNCGTWLDIGMLFGKSPKLLVEILNRVQPKIELTEVPIRVSDFLESEGSDKG